MSVSTRPLNTWNAALSNAADLWKNIYMTYYIHQNPETTHSEKNNPQSFGSQYNINHFRNNAKTAFGFINIADSFYSKQLQILASTWGLLFSEMQRPLRSLIDKPENDNEKTIIQSPDPQIGKAYTSFLYSTEQWNNIIEHLTYLQGMYKKASLSSLEQMVLYTAEQLIEKKSIVDLNVFYNEWLFTNENAFANVFQTEAHADALEQVLKARAEILRTFKTLLKLTPSPEIDQPEQATNDIVRTDNRKHSKKRDKQTT